MNNNLDLEADGLEAQKQLAEKQLAWSKEQPKRRQASRNILATRPGVARTLRGTRPQTGRLFDTHDEHVVMYPAILVTALALFVLSQAQGTAALLCAGLLLGIGFANFQSVGQAVSLSLVSRSRYAQATTTFYIFFDLGIGLGPYIFGYIIPQAGYSGMYLTLSMVVLGGVAVYRLVHGGRAR